MESVTKKDMYETDLTYLEDKVVSAAFSWLSLNPDVPWDDASGKPNKLAALNNLTRSLSLKGALNVTQSSTVDGLPF